MSEKVSNSQKSCRNKMRILIMDDEGYIRNALIKLINYMGHEVSSAKNGFEAINIFKEARKKQRPFDIVILDLIIKGGIGGEDTIRELKQFDPKIKAIVSSDFSNDRIMSDYKKYGFCDALIKPYGLTELAKVLNRVIRRI